jgi:hypothetical protein
LNLNASFPLKLYGSKEFLVMFRAFRRPVPIGRI